MNTGGGHVSRGAPTFAFVPSVSSGARKSQRSLRLFLDLASTCAQVLDGASEFNPRQAAVWQTVTNSSKCHHFFLLSSAFLPRRAPPPTPPRRCYAWRERRQAGRRKRHRRRVRRLSAEKGMEESGGEAPWSKSLAVGGVAMVTSHLLSRPRHFC